MSDLDRHLERMRSTIRREAAALEGVAKGLDESAGRAVELMLGTRGHVLIGGAGTSNAVARRFAHLLSCSGQPALFIHPADSLHGGLGAVKPEDTVILISKGGGTAEVNRFAEIAKSRGAGLIAFTEDPGSELGRLADIVVRVKIPETATPSAWWPPRARSPTRPSPTQCAKRSLPPGATPSRRSRGPIPAEPSGRRSKIGGSGMKAVFFEGQEELRIESVPRPVCGAEESCFRWRPAGSAAATRGASSPETSSRARAGSRHEPVGIISEVGGP